MIVVNAANRAKAWEHIVDQKKGTNVRLRDISDDIGLLAVQGPNADAAVGPLAHPYQRPGLLQVITGKVAGVGCFVSRTGYTGEDGFELYCRGKDTVKLWEAILEAGAKPIGLGARDSLRPEMGYALYGNDIDETITPLEAGLGWIVKLDKGAPFTGLEALKQQKLRGVTRKLVGFELTERGLPRHGYPVWSDGRRWTSSGAGPESLARQAIGTTSCPRPAKVGTEFEVDCRGQRVRAVVVSRPFWKKGSARKNA